MGTLRPEPWQSQEGFSYRFGWSHNELAAIAPDCGAIVVVDVLRFSTTVTIDSELGASVQTVAEADGQQLSNSQIRTIARQNPGATIDMWSGNGARVALAAFEYGVAVFAGSLRNAAATAAAARAEADDAPIAVVAAGELWPDGTLRPATEDLFGAGAVLVGLDPHGSLTEPCCSPAARAARAAFLDAQPLMLDLLTATASGRQLWERGDGDDVRDAARIDVADVAIQLIPPSGG